MSSLRPAEPAPRLRGAGASDVGRVRKHNEDVVLVREELQLFIVADGAGGHDSGDLAADLAVISVSTYIEASEEQAADLPDFDRHGYPHDARRLAIAMQRANLAVYDVAVTHAKERGMGTTLVAALYSPTIGLLHVAHVGDSRCYRLRGEHLEQLTWDHSLINDVVAERPELDDALLDGLPKHVVTRALGMKASVRVSLRSFDVAPGDRYLLCSDGLSTFVPTPAIAAILADARPPGAIVQLLLNAANDAGGRDNIGIVVFECEASAAPPPRRWPAPAEARPAPGAAGRSGRGSFDSEPELLLLGIEELELSAKPRVAPPDSNRPVEWRALSELIGPKPKT